MNPKIKAKGKNMKNEIITSLAVISVALLFYFSVSAFTGNEKKLIPGNAVEIQSDTGDTFTNCIFNASFNDINNWGLGATLHVARNLDKYKELNFNAVHSYDENGSEVYGRNYDTLNDNQIDNYKYFLDSVDNYGDLNGFFERSFLSKYCYGQRLIYEVAQDSGNQTLNYGFVYQTRECGNYEMDSGRTVVHATPGLQDSGYLCRGIHENLQHSDLFEFRQNDKGTWYIKPVMRIPIGMDTGISVVRIDVIAFNGDTVKQIDIKTDNFKVDNGFYYGEYIEKYINLPTLNDLKISGDTNSTDLNFGREENWQDWNENGKVDFRVYWYGMCEVWFDRVIVDDQVANELFNPINQSAYITTRIKQEVSKFANHGSLYSFFMDEVFISQYPCMKYVVEKMRENTLYHPKFSLAVTRNADIIGLKNDSLGYSIYLDSIKPDFIQVDHHGFQSYIQPLPATIPRTDDKIPQEWKASNNYEYNQTLQNVTLGGKNDSQVNNSAGSLISELSSVKQDRDLYYPQATFIMQPQIHGWLWYDDDKGEYTHGSREPTNEEIQAQAMISLVYGADGLCWFIYNSKIIDYSPKPDLYMIGLLDPVDGITKRTVNSYGQDKWEYVSQMNAKIKNWIPVLENIYWQEGLSVHQNGTGNKYIKDIKSIYRNASNQFVDDPSCTNCDNIKYWEVGYFLPDDQTDKSKYFLMVNRRCVPETTQGIGDIRHLKIKFDSTQLTGFKNWIIKDINTGKNITFNKNNLGSDGYLNLGNDTGSIGYFNPGEGKLFKLSPVMTEGGTFVCDEAVSPSTFTCNGTVFNNGYDLTISPNTIITFSNDAGIEMNGGSFECGEYSTEDNMVTLNGTDSSKGIVLSNCSNVGIYNTNINDLKNDSSETAVLILNTYNINMKGCVFDAAANSGGINISFTNDPQDSLSLNISECIFMMGSSGCDAVSISSNGSPTGSVLIDWCTFTTSNDSSNALRLINVTGGAVKNSTFVNFNTTISALGSAFDMYNNKILGKTYSTGIFCADASNITLKPISGNYLGGYNYIKNYGTSSSCINVNNSYFDINYGENDFDLSDLDNSKFFMERYTVTRVITLTRLKTVFMKTALQMLRQIILLSGIIPVTLSASHLLITAADFHALKTSLYFSTMDITTQYTEAVAERGEDLTRIKL